MSGRWLALDVVAGLVGCLLAVELVHALFAPLPLPSPVAPPKAATGSVDTPATSTADTQVEPDLVTATNLFSPSRSEERHRVTTTRHPRPILHGIVMDGARSRAYLEDPVARRVFGYRTDDVIAGGRVVSIESDRVTISRVEGPLELLLQDPAKPGPTATSTGAALANTTPSTSAPTVPALRPESAPVAEPGPR